MKTIRKSYKIRIAGQEAYAIKKMDLRAELLKAEQTGKNFTLIYPNGDMMIFTTWRGKPISRLVRKKI